MSEQVYEGGCHCGAVRYRAVGEAFSHTNCFCSSCRKTAAAPYIPWVSFHSDQFIFTQGEPGRYISSPPVIRTFCRDCGTPLTYRHQDFAHEIDVTVCSLDQPDLAPPADQIWTMDKPAWVHLDERLPAYAKGRKA